MRKTRQQKGCIQKQGRWWILRYHDYVEGSNERKLKYQRLALVSREYKTKKSVEPLVHEILKPVNAEHYSPLSTMSISQFVESHFLPDTKKKRRTSTAKSYKNIWEAHLKHRCGDTRLRDFTTWHGENLLDDIAARSNYSLSKYTLRNIKWLLGAIFKHAIRVGALKEGNPIPDVSIPKGKAPTDTYAYSLEEVKTHIQLLREPAKTIVALASFTALRRGELAALRWKDYRDGELNVTQSVWEGSFDEPKTASSKSAVPVIPYLNQILDGYRMYRGNPESGLLFPSGKATPLNLNNLANRVIKPTLKKAGLEWHGWHAYRRGLATNLHQLGVSDKTIQRILRHSNVSTTRNMYIKSIPEDAKQAMHKVNEQMFTNVHQSEYATGSRVV